MTAGPFQAVEELGIHLRHHRPGEHRAACPECGRGPRDDALAVRLDINGGAMWLCHRCGWKGGIGPERPQSLGRPAPQRQARQPEPECYAVLAAWARVFWGTCRPIEPGTVAAKYLDTRRCEFPHPEGDVRWHPRVKHWQSDHIGPAMVGLVTHVETGDPLSLHYTWIAPDGSGKAALERPRLFLPKHTSKGIIRLWPDDEVTLGLTIGEGIESCLAAARAGLTPVWAAMDAGNLAGFPVLPGLDGITLLVDHDPPNRHTGKRAGTEAALALIERYAAAGFDRLRDIVVIMSPVEGEDAADLEAA